MVPGGAVGGLLSFIIRASGAIDPRRNIGGNSVVVDVITFKSFSWNDTAVLLKIFWIFFIRFENIDRKIRRKKVKMRNQIKQSELDKKKSLVCIPDFPHRFNNWGWVIVKQSGFLGETISSNSDSLSLELNRDTKVMTSHPLNADRTLVVGTFNCLFWHFVLVVAESSSNSSVSKKSTSFVSWYPLPDFLCLLRRFVWNAFVASSVGRTGADLARIRGRRAVLAVGNGFPCNWACLESLLSTWVASLSLYGIFSGFYCKKMF